MADRIQRFHRWARRSFAQGFDSEWKSRAFLLTMGTVALFFPFSLFFVAGGFLSAGFGWMSSVIIVFSGGATLLSELRSESVRTTLARCIVISGIFFFVEFVGLNTGFPFGSYQYTRTLGLHVAGVPVAIGIAWYSTVMNTWRIAEHLSGGLRTAPPIVIAVSAGLLTMALDIALEPMAGLIQGYWQWEGNVIPAHNYVSWFLLSSTAVYLLAMKTGKKRPEMQKWLSSVALCLFGFQFALFVLTNVFNGYVLASAVALIIVLSLYAVRTLTRVALSDRHTVKP